MQKEHVTPAAPDAVKNPISTRCQLAQTAPAEFPEMDGRAALLRRHRTNAETTCGEDGGTGDGIAGAMPYQDEMRNSEQSLPHGRGSDGRAALPRRHRTNEELTCGEDGGAGDSGAGDGGTGGGSATCDLPYPGKPGDELNDYGVQLLIAAVVEQAICDYRRMARRGDIVGGKLGRPSRDKDDDERDRDEREAENDAREILHFFSPDGPLDNFLFTAGINIDPDLIREQLGIPVSVPGVT